MTVIPTSPPNPSVVDIPYDGIDTNCDNLNDYDQDEDGYSPPEYTIDGPVSNDCDDLDPNMEDPGVTEVFYDGIDSDCNFQDDYDQDLDGYVPLVHIGKPTAAVDGAEISRVVTVTTKISRYVGAIEDLGDSQADYDCDIYPTADACPIGNSRDLISRKCLRVVNLHQRIEWLKPEGC